MDIDSAIVAKDGMIGDEKGKGLSLSSLKEAILLKASYESPNILATCNDHFKSSQGYDSLMTFIPDSVCLADLDLVSVGEHTIVAEHDTMESSIISGYN